MEIHMPGITKEGKHVPLCTTASPGLVSTVKWVPVKELHCRQCSIYARREEYEPDQTGAMIFVFGS